MQWQVHLMQSQLTTAPSYVVAYRALATMEAIFVLQPLIYASGCMLLFLFPPFLVFKQPGVDKMHIWSQHRVLRFRLPLILGTWSLEVPADRRAVMTSPPADLTYADAFSKV